MLLHVGMFKRRGQTIVMIFLSLLLISPAFATNESFVFNVEDIEPLQGEYQKHLNIPQTQNSSRHYTATINKQRDIQQKELRKYQRLNTPQETNKAIYRQAQLLANVLPEHVEIASIVSSRVETAADRAKDNPVSSSVKSQIKAPALTPNGTPLSVKSVFFDAAKKGDVSAIASFLKNGGDINQSNRQKETALHMAAAKGHYSTVVFLIRNGADIHAVTVNNWMPIHYATRFSHLEIANFLKRSGASIHAKTTNGLSAVDLAKLANAHQMLNIFGVN